MKITKHIRYIRIVLMSGINSNLVREAIVVYVCWGIAKGVSPAPPAAILPSLHYQDASLLLLLLFFPLLMPIIRDSITGIKERERGPPCPLLLFHRDLAWVQKAFFYPLPPLPLRLVCLCTSLATAKRGKPKGEIQSVRQKVRVLLENASIFGGNDCLFYSIHGMLWDSFLALKHV